MVLGNGRFGEFPARLAEACWLATVVLIPISADLQAGQIFTAPKTALTQILGICSALALCLHFIDAQRIDKSFAKIATAAISFLAVSWASQYYALDPTRAGDTSGVSSLAPMHLACQAAILLATAFFLRSAQQLERLIAAALAAGFIVGIFALFEAYGFKAPGYAVVPGMQIASFVGGPIFLAGYLLMLVPPAVWNLHRHLGRSHGHLDRSTATAAVVLLVLVAAFLVCDKRGPTLGLLAALCSGMILVAAARRKQRLVLAALAAALVAGVVLAGLAALKKSAAPLQGVPFVERLAAIIPLESDRNHDYRTMLWALLPEVILASEPVTLPTGAQDPHHRIRPLVGYGPDNVQAVLPSRYIFLQAWPSEVMEVSSHNHFWDLLINLGAAGVAAFFGVFFIIWYQGLLSMGTRPPPILWAAALAGCFAITAGAIAAIVLPGGFIGAAAQAGFLAGLLCLCMLQQPGATVSTAGLPSDKLLVAALLASLAGHWIDLIFIFPTAENSALFWVFGGALCAQWQQHGKLTKNGLSTETDQQRWTVAIGVALIVSVVHARAVLGPLLAGQAQLSELFGAGSSPLLVGALALLGVWAVCGLSAPSQERSASTFENLNCTKILCAGVLYLAAVFWFARVALRFPPSAGQAWLSDVWTLHLPFLLVTGVVWCAAYSFRPSQRQLLGDMPLVPTALFFLMLLLIWVGPMRDLRSSIFAGLARALPNSGAWIDRSISLRPELMRNYYNLADRLMLEGFVKGRDDKTKAAALDKAEDTLRRGLQVSSFNLLSAKLGRLLLWRACEERTDERASVIAIAARQALEQALRFAPQNEPAWIDASLLENLIFRNPATAVEKMRRANEVTLQAEPWQNVVKENWGEYYMGLAFLAPSTTLRKDYARRAAFYLRLHLAEVDKELHKNRDQAVDDEKIKELVLARSRSQRHLGQMLEMLRVKSEGAALDRGASARHGNKNETTSPSDRD
jgi:hypothetical protein